MPRLDQERQKELEPKRMQYAIDKITSLGLNVSYSDSQRIKFEYNGEDVNFWPYSGWHTGKSIKDGRGINKLLKQLANKESLALKK